jgi:hypothetical protein
MSISAVLTQIYEGIAGNVPAPFGDVFSQIFQSLVAMLQGLGL